mgnify:CR=1 FL=1|jgi:hypothetical protein
MLVKATDKYKKLNITDKELNKIPQEGEEFEVTEERYKVLTKTNQYKVVFVEKVEAENKSNNITKGKKKNNVS